MRGRRWTLTREERILVGLWRSADGVSKGLSAIALLEARIERPVSSITRNIPFSVLKRFARAWRRAANGPRSS